MTVDGKLFKDCRMLGMLSLAIFSMSCAAQSKNVSHHDVVKKAVPSNSDMKKEPRQSKDKQRSNFNTNGSSEYNSLEELKSAISKEFPQYQFVQVSEPFSNRRKKYFAVVASRSSAEWEIPKDGEFCSEIDRAVLDKKRSPFLTSKIYLVQDFNGRLSVIASGDVESGYSLQYCVGSRVLFIMPIFIKGWEPCILTRRGIAKGNGDGGYEAQMSCIGKGGSLQEMLRVIIYTERWWDVQKDPSCVHKLPAVSYSDQSIEIRATSCDFDIPKDHYWKWDGEKFVEQE